jgi:type II secretory pathway component PulC
LRLQDGDVILDIGGREPTTPEHAMRILASFQPGETLKIAVMRKQRRETLEFKLPDEAASRG